LRVLKLSFFGSGLGPSGQNHRPQLEEIFSPEWLGQALASQANPGYSDALDQGIWYDPPFMGSSREIFSGENFQQAARTYLCHLCRLLEDIFRVSFFFFWLPSFSHFHRARSTICDCLSGRTTPSMVPHVVTGWTRHVRQMLMETGDQPTSGWCQFQSPMGPAWVQVGLVASCGGNLACSCRSTCLLSLSNYSHPRRPPTAIHG
jgi:hypothetical protein